jgi:hypothetical protein
MQDSAVSGSSSSSDASQVDGPTRVHGNMIASRDAMRCSSPSTVEWFAGFVMCLIQAVSIHEAHSFAAHAAGCDAGYYFNRSSPAMPSCSPCELGFICQPSQHYVAPAAKTAFDRKACAAYGPGLTTKRGMSTAVTQCGEPGHWFEAVIMLLAAPQVFVQACERQCSRHAEHHLTACHTSCCTGQSPAARSHS